jgi:C4-type Zn-finger protein
MKLLKCSLCQGEVDVIGNDHAINKKTKCQKCGHTSAGIEVEAKAEPEVVVIRRRPLVALD